MKSNVVNVMMGLFVVVVIGLTGCGGGGGGSGTPVPTSTYTVSGQVQKGPFGIGSQISVNELDGSLNPTGKVYNVQTSDDLGNFAVASEIGTNLVEIVGDGFYMDDLTGQMAASRIQLRAVADLSVNAKPTVNILTSLQAQRLKNLISQGSTYTAANTQSQNEVLSAFGIDPTKINSLSTLYSMQINGSTDADSVLLATSAILSKMATNAAVANSTTQPAELSNYISTIAAQITNTGTITGTEITTARDLAATQIDPAVVRSNLETYYAARGVTVAVPKLEEWLDQQGTGILPNRTASIPKRKYAIGANGYGLTVFSINATTGELTSIGAVATPSGSVTVDPTGKYVYARDFSTLNISAYSINATTGVLTSIGTVSGGDGIYIPPAFVPSGKFAYVVLQYTGVSVYTIDASTGALSNNGMVVTDDQITSIAVDPTGKFAYVISEGSIHNPITDEILGSVSAYTINSTTGALTLVGTVPTTSHSPRSVTVDPTVKFVYVADGSNVAAYSINTTSGALTLVDTAGVPDGYYSISVSVDPTGGFVYVPYTDNVAAYSINATTGALTLSDTLPCPVASSNAAVDPTSKFFYVSTGGISGVNSPVFTYTIDASTGELTQIGQAAMVGTGGRSIAVIAPQ